MGKVISFCNNKGGVGKTFCASNIGYSFAMMGKKVLFIDLDSQSNLTSIISKTETSEQAWENTLEDAFIVGEELGLPIVHTANPNIDFVPTDLDLANFEKDMARISFKELLLMDLVQPVKDKYDYIVIDCPPSLSVLTYNAMIASDYLILVTNPEGSSCKGLGMIVNLYNEIINNKRFNPSLRIIGCMVTNVDRANVSKYYLDYLEKNFGEILLKPFIPKSTKVVQSTSLSNFIFEQDPGGKISQAMQDLASEIVCRIADEGK